VTVHSIGFGWWRRLVDRCDWPIFCRVTTVSLDGPRYKSDVLPQLAKLSDLEELSLWNTSITSHELEQWKQQHPRVAVAGR